MKLRLFVAVFTGALLVAAAGPAAADQALWEAGLGAGLLRLPHYRGSDQTRTWLLPVPYVVYRGQILRADRDGARAVLFDGERIDFDLSVAASAPTRSEGNDARQGMADLAPTVEIGPKLNVNLVRGGGWKLDLRVPLRAVVTLESRPRHVGWTLAPVLNLDTRVQGFNLGLQTGPMWGDRRLHRYFYDVAPADASAARPAYRSAGGSAGWQATAALSRRSGATWMGMFLRADTLRGAAFDDSPLVKRRSGVSFGVAVSWVLATSAQRVADRED